MTMIASNIQQVRQCLAAACVLAQRPVQSVTLLCVSKTHTQEAVRQAVAAGERCFGENYVQEGVQKITALADLRHQLEWHLIGPVQSNKTRQIAEHFDWVHTLDRFKIAQRLSDQRPTHFPPLQVCLQINISGQASKSGVPAQEALELAQQVAQLPGLTLRGLMAIGQSATEPALQRAPHKALRELQQNLCVDQTLALDTLSMGMSADLQAAVLEGATLVRVGTAIFGQR
jgi:PLP dependent protein